MIILPRIYYGDTNNPQILVSDNKSQLLLVDSYLKATRKELSTSKYSYNFRIHLQAVKMIYLRGQIYRLNIKINILRDQRVATFL